jgi:hypothetical protein
MFARHLNDTWEKSAVVTADGAEPVKSLQPSSLYPPRKNSGYRLSPSRSEP